VNAVPRVIGRTLTAAVAGAGLAALGAVVFVELIQPRLHPPEPGEGFNALGLVFYLFGIPCGAVIGATAGLIWSPYRWGQPGQAPADVFGYLFSFLAPTGALGLPLLVGFRADRVKPLGWLLFGGLTAYALVAARAFFWLARRSTGMDRPNPEKQV
jgi:hypothetical protein